MAAHHEVHFEQYITEQLVNNGWKEGHSSHYDQQRAIYPSLPGCRPPSMMFGSN